MNLDVDELGKAGSLVNDNVNILAGVTVLSGQVVITNGNVNVVGLDIVGVEIKPSNDKLSS